MNFDLKSILHCKQDKSVLNVLSDESTLLYLTKNKRSNITLINYPVLITGQKDGVLKIYNDGKHIDEQFIQNGFKPYEKGSDGKFGLGMSIVCRTLDYFNMSLTAENNEVGVTFTIQAK